MALQREAGNIFGRDEIGQRDSDLGGLVILVGCPEEDELCCTPLIPPKNGRSDACLR
jgi:hypothetical protein